MPEPDRLDIAALRQEYEAAGLDEAAIAADPVAQFRTWLDAALAAAIPEPNAMVLSTVDEAGVPSSRTVLLKGLDERGFAFFTNRESRKARDLAVNANAALVFPWIAIRRQVAVCGEVTPVDDAESDAYFVTRPRGSQLAAWASDQSRPLADREMLHERMAAAAQQFGDRPVTRPPHWGGYRLEPSVVEFWQGRADRLHDRIVYTRTDGAWYVQRLFP